MIDGMPAEPNFHGAEKLDYAGNDPGDNSFNAPE